MLQSTPALWAVLAFTMEEVPPTATGPHRALASVMLTLMLMLSTDTVVLVLTPVDSSVSPVSTLDTVATLPVDSLTSSVSDLLMPGDTATLPSTAVLWAVPAFTPLAPLTATGPPRVLASVMLMLMPRLLSVTPTGPPRVPTVWDTATVLESTDMASGLLMLTVSPTATGPHREPTVWDTATVLESTDMASGLPMLTV